VSGSSGALAPFRPGDDPRRFSGFLVKPEEAFVVKYKQQLTAGTTISSNNLLQKAT
jgi:hypothetical protein